MYQTTAVGQKYTWQDTGGGGLFKPVKAEIGGLPPFFTLPIPGNAPVTGLTLFELDPALAQKARTVSEILENAKKSTDISPYVSVINIEERGGKSIYYHNGGDTLPITSAGLFVVVFELATGVSFASPLICVGQAVGGLTCTLSVSNTTYPEVPKLSGIIQNAGAVGITTILQVEWFWIFENSIPEDIPTNLKQVPDYTQQHNISLTPAQFFFLDSYLGGASSHPVGSGYNIPHGTGYICRYRLLNGDCSGEVTFNHTTTTFLIGVMALAFKPVTGAPAGGYKLAATINVENLTAETQIASIQFTIAETGQSARITKEISATSNIDFVAAFFVDAGKFTVQTTGETTQTGQIIIP